MLASAQHRFVFLCLPDELSVAVERALRRHADIRLSGAFRTLRYAEYRRLVRPLLEHELGERIGEVQVFCLFHEPLEHLHAAYRTRKGKGRLDAEVTFERFVEASLGEEVERAYRVPRQSRFVTGKGGPGEDLAMFRADDLARLAAAVSERVGKAVVLDEAAAGARPSADEMASVDLDTVRERLRREYEIYDSIARRG